METQPQDYSQDGLVMEQETLRGRQAEAEGQRSAPEAVRLSISQRLTLLYKGRVFVRYERRAGWSESLEVYAFRCPRHGIQTDYNHGFYGRLDCPRCSYSTRTHQPETDL